MIQLKETDSGKEYLDLPNLKARFSGKPELLAVIRQEFATFQKNVLSEMRTAHEEHNLEILKDLAHTLKGNAALIGALQVKELSLQIETAIAERDFEELEVKLGRLPGAMQETLEQLQCLEVD